MKYFECSLNYHRTKIEAFDVFASGVRDSYFKHNPPFTSPVITEAQFNVLLKNNNDSYMAYKNGGRLMKAEWHIAKAKLMEALDDISEDVNSVANGAEETIVLGGFKPRKVSRARKGKPDTPEIEFIEHGAEREIIVKCKKMDHATSYTCILCEGLPADGQIRIQGNMLIIPKDFAVVYIDESIHRKKSFQQLKQKEVYYAYFFARNAAGISPLSHPRSILCA